KQAQQAIGELAAGRSIVQDAAGPAVHSFPAAVAEPHPGQEGALVLDGLGPDVIGQPLRVAVLAEAEIAQPEARQDPGGDADGCAGRLMPDIGLDAVALPKTADFLDQVFFPGPIERPLNPAAPPIRTDVALCD